MMKTLDKWIKRIIILTAMFLAMFFFFPRLHLFSKIGNWFKPKPVLINDTPLIIIQIKNIALLNTAVFAQDVILDTVFTVQPKKQVFINPFAALPFTTKKEIVLIVNGKVTAGIDLKNMPDSAVFADGDSVRIFIHSAKITDVFVNPSGVETFYESGTWSNSETKVLLMVAKLKLLLAADKHRLIQKANEKAIAVLTQFLNASGFKKINIIIKYG